MNESSHHRSFTLRVLQGTSKNDVIGGAFLIYPGIIISCAHVISEALNCSVASQPTAPVRLDFPLLKGHPIVTASVIHWLPPVEGCDSEHLEDIAILTINSALPEGATPIHLPKMDKYDGISVSVYGFPYSKGRNQRGELIESIANGWIQIDTEIGRPGILEGYSGSAAREQKSDRIVGMVVAREIGEHSSYLIPASHLLKAIDATPFSHALSQDQLGFQKQNKISNIPPMAVYLMNYTEHERIFKQNVQKHLQPDEPNRSTPLVCLFHGNEKETVSHGISWRLERILKTLLPQCDPYHRIHGGRGIDREYFSCDQPGTSGNNFENLYSSLNSLLTDQNQTNNSKAMKNTLANHKFCRPVLFYSEVNVRGCPDQQLSSFLTSFCNFWQNMTDQNHLVVVCLFLFYPSSVSRVQQLFSLLKSGRMHNPEAAISTWSNSGRNNTRNACCFSLPRIRRQDAVTWLYDLKSDINTKHLLSDTTLNDLLHNVGNLFEKNEKKGCADFNMHEIERPLQKILQQIG